MVHEFHSRFSYWAWIRLRLEVSIASMMSTTIMTGEENMGEIKNHDNDIGILLTCVKYKEHQSRRSEALGLDQAASNSRSYEVSQRKGTEPNSY